jgi:hypothetical protein
MSEQIITSLSSPPHLHFLNLAVTRCDFNFIHLAPPNVAPDQQAGVEQPADSQADGDANKETRYHLRPPGGSLSMLNAIIKTITRMNNTAVIVGSLIILTFW